MRKPDKQTIIDFIISCLEKGEQRGNILVKTGKKWGTSKSAFDRWLKIAKQQLTDKQQAIKKELEAIDKAAAIEARKKAIMTADERKEYLTKIINGEVKFKKPFFVKGKIMEYPAEPDVADRMKAISELNKMEGDYAETAIRLKGDALSPLEIFINGKPAGAGS
jgi:hypothetical protein